MNLNKLELGDFRNYQEISLEFDPGVNLILGRNAQGKTNLLEAIGYLGTGRSFRTSKSSELIRFGMDFAQIRGCITSQSRNQTLRWVIFPNGRRRVLECNGVKKKTAGEIRGMLPSVLFCPEDLMILKGGSAPRRRLGDLVLCQLRPNYDAALTEYNRILEQKSQILKDWRERPSVLEILPEYDRRLCQVGALLISYRARFYKSLAEAAAQYHQAFSGGAEDFSLEYKTVSTVTDPFAPLPQLEQDLMDHLQSHHRGELDSGLCLTGPHKDDFDLFLSGINLKLYGSQGQTRTAVISLKLAQRELMRRESGEQPLLLLDDVLSELDPGRQDFVLNQIDKGQVFITGCEPGRLTKLGKTIEIQGGRLVP